MRRLAPLVLILCMAPQAPMAAPPALERGREAAAWDRALAQLARAESADSCSSIHDDDLENLCKGGSSCTSIHDDDLENLCKGRCTSIHDDDLENACKGHLSRRATAAAGWWFKKHKH